MELPRACYGLFAHCFIQDDTKYDFNPILNESQNPCTKFQDVFRVLMYADNIIREAVGTIFFSIMRFVTHTHTRTNTQTDNLQNYYALCIWMNIYVTIHYNI